MPVTARAVSRYPPNFVPGQRREPGFDDVPTLSTLQWRFTHVCLPGSHLTRSCPAFSKNAHHPGHWARAASGGLGPDPAARSRGAVPHLLCSKAAFSWPLWPPFCAVVAQHRQHTESGEPCLGVVASRLAVGSPQGIAPPGLPRIRTCPTRASGSSVHGFATRRGRERSAVAGADTASATAAFSPTILRPSETGGSTTSTRPVWSNSESD